MMKNQSIWLRSMLFQTIIAKAFICLMAIVSQAAVATHWKELPLVHVPNRINHSRFGTQLLLQNQNSFFFWETISTAIRKR